MSATIDERVVEMKFDNSQFERNANTTISTLDKLKNTLNMSESSKSLNELSNTASKFNMDGMVSAVDGVGNKFSVLETIAKSVLYNLTTSAMNSASQIANTFGIGLSSVKAGFEEYETQMNAVQTILANTSNKGSTLDDVNNALDTLNTYADKTIYNFTEMTRNIGTFTAAGVDLDTSVDAIKGIANLAAVSGSTSQQASTAMYQLSQALASGTVKLQDWNSVVNAGMGGEVFQNALKRTAKNMGTDVDALIDKYGSFRESLSRGEWLTTEVLTETLGQFAGAYDEASLKEKGYTKDQISDILSMSKTAEDAATKVKTFTQFIDTVKEELQSGWTQTWETLIGDFEEAKELWGNIFNAIQPFIQASSQARNELLKTWADLGGRDTAIKAISNAFHALLNILTPIKEAFQEVFPKPSALKLIEITNSFRDFTERVKEFTEQIAPKLKEVFITIFTVVKTAVGILKTAVGVIASFGSVLIEIAGDIAGTFNKAIDFAAKRIEDFKKGVSSDDDFSLIDNIISGFEKLKEVLSGTGNKIVGVLDAIGVKSESLKKLAEYANLDIKMPGFEKLHLVIKGIWEIVSTVGSKIVTVMSNIGSALSNAINVDNIQGIMGIFNLAMVSKLIKSLTEFSNKAVGSLGDIKKIKDSIIKTLGEVRGCFEEYQKKLKAEALLKIAEAIGILAVSLLIIASIDSDKLATALMGISGLFAGLMVSMNMLNKMDAKKLGGAASSLMIMEGMASSILILAGALKIISTIDAAGIFKSLVAIGVLMTEMAIFMKKTEKSKGSSAGLIGMAIAMNVLAKAAKTLGDMDIASLSKAIVAVGALMAEMALFAKFSSGSGKMVAIGIGMIGVAVAVKILASALDDLGGMKMSEIGKGLLAMAGALGMITVALMAIPATSIFGATAIVSVALAMKVLASALEDMGGMKMSEIGKGLLTMGAALAMLALALNGMLAALPGAAALLIAAGALAILTPSLMILGHMKLTEIGKGLLAIAGVLAVIGGSAIILAPLLPVITGLSIAFAAFGVSIAAIGAGVLMLSLGFTALSAMTAAAATSVVASLAIIITGLLSLIPAIAVSLVDGFKAMIITLATAFDEIVPALLKMLDDVLKALSKYAPKIFDYALKGIEGFIKAIAKNMKGIVKAALDVVSNFIAGIAAGLPGLAQAGADLIISFIESIADAIDNNKDRLAAAMEKLGLAMLDALISIFTHGVDMFKKAGDKLMNIGFIKGIVEGIKPLATKIKDSITKALSSISEFLSPFFEIGKNLIQGFINGIASLTGTIAGKIAGIGKIAISALKKVLGIHSPSKEFYAIGEFSGLGLCNALSDYTSKVGNAASNLGKKALDGLSNSMSTISDYLSDGIDANPVISPVLDLSDVKSGINGMNGLFSSASIGGTLSMANAVGGSFNSKIQNENEVVSAINNLGTMLSGLKGGDTYNVNGITYDDGSNITDAISTLVRAVQVERRI